MLVGILIRFIKVSRPYVSHSVTSIFIQLCRFSSTFLIMTPLSKNTIFLERNIPLKYLLSRRFLFSWEKLTKKHCSEGMKTEKRTTISRYPRPVSIEWKNQRARCKKWVDIGWRHVPRKSILQSATNKWPNYKVKFQNSPMRHCKINFETEIAFRRIFILFGYLMNLSSNWTSLVIEYLNAKLFRLGPPCSKPFQIKYFWTETCSRPL